MGEGIRRRHEIFHRLVDEVHVGDGNVGVVAGELDLADVSPPPEEDVLGRQCARRAVQGFRNEVDFSFTVGGIRLGEAAVPQEVEHVDEVRRGAVHRAAVLAGAQVQRTEEGLPVGYALDAVGRRVGYGGQRQAPGGHPEVREKEHRRRRHVLGVLVDLAGFRLPTQRIGVPDRERALTHARDVLRGVQAVVPEHLHLRVAGRHAIEPLHRGDLLRHLGPVLRGDAVERPGIHGEVALQPGAGEIEGVDVVREEGEKMLPTTQGHKAQT